MVGSDACRDSQKASRDDSTADSRASRPAFESTIGSPSLQLTRLNKAVPVSPSEFWGGGNVFDRL